MDKITAEGYSPLYLQLREIIRKSAGAFPRITVIEGPEIFPAEDEFYVDGTHPNDAGMAVYAARLARLMGRTSASTLRGNCRSAL